MYPITINQARPFATAKYEKGIGKNRPEEFSVAGGKGEIKRRGIKRQERGVGENRVCMTLKESSLSSHPGYILAS